jgi:hypothetical protein
MTQTNGTRGSEVAVSIPEHPPILESTTAGVIPARGTAEPATRAKQRAREQIRQNRFVIIAAGAVVTALLLFAMISAPRKALPQKTKDPAATGQNAELQGENLSAEKNLLPITDSGRPAAKEMHDGYMNEQDLQRTAIRRAPSSASHPPSSASMTGTLGSIPPFGEQPWQAPPYQPGFGTNVPSENRDPGKAEREAMDKSSLVYVRNISAMQPLSQSREVLNGPTDIGLGLATGTRLRARLESAASTAVRTPVLAVIEYNYERDGEIVVPAGAKAVGHIQEADRSGYMRIEFDSLILPDGAAVPIQAAATDLEMRPLKGKVDGKNRGKNALVRSLSGIGQIGAMLVGRPSLNQPFSESDLLRERVSTNIGEASDEEISKLAVTAHVVVSVAAGTSIYVVLEQTAKPNVISSSSTSQGRRPLNSATVDELRQLLQLQRELGQANTSSQ